MRLAAARNLPNQLDLANIAEEIEDVGAIQLRAVESSIVSILGHLLLA